MTGSRLEIALGRPAFAVALDAGEVVAVDDPAGRTVAALLTGVGGTASLDDRPLRGGLAARVRAGLGVVSGAPVAPDVTVEDHLAARIGLRRARALLDGSLLVGRGADPAGILSGGERTVLAWLRCVATEPRAVLLEAAGAGLDASTLAWAGDQVRRWSDTGVPVLVRVGRPEERAWATGPIVVVPGP